MAARWPGAPFLGQSGRFSQSSGAERTGRAERAWRRPASAGSRAHPVADCAGVTHLTCEPQVGLRGSRPERSEGGALVARTSGERPRLRVLKVGGFQYAPC